MNFLPNVSSSGRTLLLLAIILLVGVTGYYILNAPDRRSTGQKIDDAVNELPNGLDKAGRQLESRTPGEKLGDAVRDAGDDARKATNQQ